MGTENCVNLSLAWNGIRLGPLPDSTKAARKINWLTDGAPRLPDLETDRLAELVKRAEQTGLIVRLWIEGKRVTDLRQAHQYRTLAVCGWKEDSDGRWYDAKIAG
jgi:hypothetical protein